MTTNTIFEGFETGSYAPGDAGTWTKGGGGTLTVNTDSKRTGTYGITQTCNSSNNTFNISVSDTTISTYSVWVQYKAVGASCMSIQMYNTTPSSGTQGTISWGSDGVYMRMRGTGEVGQHSADTPTLNKWYKFEMTHVSGTNTGTFTIYDSDGTTVLYTDTNSVSETGWTNDKISIPCYRGTYYADDVYYNKLISYPRRPRVDIDSTQSSVYIKRTGETIG